MATAAGCCFGGWQDRRSRLAAAMIACLLGLAFAGCGQSGPASESDTGPAGADALAEVAGTVDAAAATDSSAGTDSDAAAAGDVEVESSLGTDGSAGTDGTEATDGTAETDGTAAMPIG